MGEKSKSPPCRNKRDKGGATLSLLSRVVELHSSFQTGVISLRAGGAFWMTLVRGFSVRVASLSQEGGNVKIGLLEVGDHGVAHAVERDDIR
jgi:hypothetical protein